jgi:hypothetical protein
VDVYNLGFSGDNTFVESLRVRTRWQELSPRLVISLDGRNDYHAWFVDASVEGTGHPGSVGVDGLYNASGSLGAVGSQIHAWLVFRSALYKAMSELLPGPQERYPRRGASERVEEAARHYLANHAGTTAWLEGVGVPHAVFVQPTLGVAKPPTPAEHEMMAGFAAEAEGGQAYFDDLARYYRAVSELARGTDGVHDLSGLFEGRAERLYVDSVHYNDLANDLIAGEICAAVLREYGHLLRGEGGPAPAGG